MGAILLLGMGVGAQAPAPGTPAAQGEQVFGGSAPLKNGGPPCTMCHSAAQLGMAHKGTIGPDLSTMYAGLGDEGLESMLSDHLPPTMAPIYGAHPLTAGERDEIIAYLSGGKAKPEAKSEAQPAQHAEGAEHAEKPNVAAPAAQPAAAAGANLGAQLFSGAVALKNGGPACTICHSAAGLGFAGRGTMGPDLSSIYASQGANGLQGLLSTNLPATMAPIYSPHPLTPEERSALITFFSGKTGPASPTAAAAAMEQAPAAAPTPPPPPPPPTPALIAEGDHLFNGQLPMHNGGPACIACHSAAGNRFPNGGTLGPDLTTIYTRIGAIGLGATLQTLFFPAMQPLYQSHSLTPQEQQALEAYFQSIAQQAPPRATPGIAAWAGITFLILLGITGILGRRHTAGVRRRLVTAARRGPRRADLIAAAQIAATHTADGQPNIERAQ